MKAVLSWVLKYLLVPCLLLPTTKQAISQLWTQQWSALQNSTQQTILFLLVFVALSSVYFTFLFWWQLSPQRRERRLRTNYVHDPKNDISTHRRTGRRVCTRCLHSERPVPYPLHACRNGYWYCSAAGCGATYKDPSAKLVALVADEALQKQSQSERNA